MLRTLTISVFALAPLAAQENFTRDVWPWLDKAGCAGCHNTDGVASTTRLQFPEAAANAQEREFFGDSLRRFVDTADPAQSTLVMKPTNRIRHAGGRRIQPGSEAETVLIHWARRLAASKPMARVETAPAAKAITKPVLRRLTHSQYDNTVRDLLGDISRPSRQFPPEDFIDGFKNQYEGQSISPLLAEAYGEAAARLAEKVKPGDLSNFVASFGKRAFRRPLTARETARYQALMKAAGPEAVVEAMLQSPSFLYRPETATRPEDVPYVRASRLSYLLWDTMPDEALVAAAEKGGLNTPDGFEAQARRMLADPRAAAALDEFTSQWLRFDRVVTMVKDRRSHPSFTRETAVSMTEETRRFVADLVWSNRNFLEFYTSPSTFINGDMASLYGMKAPSDDFSRVAYPEGSGRAGIISHATFLALTSKPSETSPTARGLFVREQFLCQSVPQPPPGVNTNLPPQSEEKPMTNRERLQLHLNNPSCASCHNLIDPIGLGLEKYDGVGSYRKDLTMRIPSFDRKQAPRSVSVPIDSRGWVAGIEGSEFETPAQLGAALARTPQCQECLVKLYFRYAMGRRETVSDRPVIARALDDFRQSQFHFQQLMIAIAKWTEFGIHDSGRN
ncbi:MAG: DUF1592 domain-containing protein [Bryobacterales bacterium]|nr:DUF1592 domain-containing protein [Bryobacterales bacterium]